MSALATPPRAVPWTVAAERLNCGRTRIFKLLREGRLARPRERFGRDLMVTVASLEVVEREGHAPERPEPTPQPQRSRRRGQKDPLWPRD